MTAFVLIFFLVPELTSIIVLGWACLVGLKSIFVMPPFEEEGVYCFANVGVSLGR